MGQVSVKLRYLDPVASPVMIQALCTRALMLGNNGPKPMTTAAVAFIRFCGRRLVLEVLGQIWSSV